MKNSITFILVSLYFFSSSSSHGQRKFFAQDESAQHLLQGKGDTFRIFRFNTICTNWQLAEYSDTEKIGHEPSLHLADTNGSDGVIFHSHNPIVCQPFTRYRLRFQSELKSHVTGSPAQVEIKLFDYNRDYLQSMNWDIPKKDAEQGWQNKTFEFITPHNGHAVMVYLQSRRDSVCDLFFDQMYLEQISDAGACAPTPRPALEVQTHRGGFIGETELHPDERICHFSFNFSWRARPFGQKLAFIWTDKSGATVASDTCHFNPMTGLLPKWSGLQTEWTRKHGDHADKVHARLDRHTSGSDVTGSSVLKGQLLKPVSAEGLRVFLTETAPANIEINHFLIFVQRTEVD